MKIANNMIRRLTFLLLLLSFIGCSTFSSSIVPDADKIDSLRGAPPFDRRTVDLPVERDYYVKALGKDGSINSARLVQVFHRGESDSELKEYRLLDVRPGSVYQALQLRSGDIVVAANGFVIPEPPMFWNYLQLISQFEEANIEIRRNGTAILMNYKFS